MPRTSSIASPSHALAEDELVLTPPTIMHVSTAMSAMTVRCGRTFARPLKRGLSRIEVLRRLLHVQARRGENPGMRCDHAEADQLP